MEGPPAIGTLVWGKTADWPWWPGTVVPFENALFSERGATPWHGAERDGTIAVKFFCRAKIAQINPEDVERFELDQELHPAGEWVSDAHRDAFAAACNVLRGGRDTEAGNTLCKQYAVCTEDAAAPAPTADAGAPGGGKTSPVQQQHPPEQPQQIEPDRSGMVVRMNPEPEIFAEKPAGCHFPNKKCSSVQFPTAVHNHTPPSTSTGQKKQLPRNMDQRKKAAPTEDHVNHKTSNAAEGTLPSTVNEKGDQSHVQVEEVPVETKEAKEAPAAAKEPEEVVIQTVKLDLTDESDEVIEVPPAAIPAKLPTIVQKVPTEHEEKVKDELQGNAANDTAEHIPVDISTYPKEQEEKSVKEIPPGKTELTVMKQSDKLICEMPTKVTTQGLGKGHHVLSKDIETAPPFQSDDKPDVAPEEPSKVTHEETKVVTRESPKALDEVAEVLPEVPAKVIHKVTEDVPEAQKEATNEFQHAPPQIPMEIVDDEVAQLVPEALKKSTKVKKDVADEVQHVTPKAAMEVIREVKDVEPETKKEVVNTAQNVVPETAMEVTDEITAVVSEAVPAVNEETTQETTPQIQTHVPNTEKEPLSQHDLMKEKNKVAEQVTRKTTQRGSQEDGAVENPKAAQQAEEVIKAAAEQTDGTEITTATTKQVTVQRTERTLEETTMGKGNIGKFKSVVQSSDDLSETSSEEPAQNSSGESSESMSGKVPEESAAELGAEAALSAAAPQMHALGKVVWARARGWAYWPGLVVPFACMLFFPRNAARRRAREGRTVVQFFCDGTIAQVKRQNVLPIDHSADLIDYDGRHAEKIQTAYEFAREWVWKFGADGPLPFVEGIPTPPTTESEGTEEGEMADEITALEVELAGIKQRRTRIENEMFALRHEMEIIRASRRAAERANRGEYR